MICGSLIPTIIVHDMLCFHSNHCAWYAVLHIYIFIPTILFTDLLFFLWNYFILYVGTITILCKVCDAFIQTTNIECVLTLGPSTESKCSAMISLYSGLTTGTDHWTWRLNMSALDWIPPPATMRSVAFMNHMGGQRVWNRHQFGSLSA